MNTKTEDKMILGRFYVNKSREKGSVYGIGKMYLTKQHLQFMMDNLETRNGKEVFSLGIIGGMIEDKEHLDKSTGLPAKYFLIKIDQKVLNETITKNKGKTGQTSGEVKKETSKISGKTTEQDKLNVDPFF